MAIALAVACSKGITDSPKPTPTPPDPVPPVTSTDSIVTVSFTTGGEVVLSEEPLTKSIATSPDDLWGFQVIQYPDSIKKTNDVYNGSAYMCGLYDNLDSIKIPLVKGKWYGFTLTYIPNGKNELYSQTYSYGVWYGAPFNEYINKLCYGTKFGLLSSGIFELRIHRGNEESYFTSAERYQGVKWNVYATDSTTAIGINLYRMMTGVKLVAEDFTSGTLCVYGTNGTYGRGWSEEHKLEPAMDTIINTRDTIMPDSTVVTLRDTVIQAAKESILDITVQTPKMPVASTSYDYALAGYDRFDKKIMEEQPFYDEQEGLLQVVYKDTTGVEVLLYSNEKFEFKRLTKHVIKLNVGKILNEKEAGFEPDVKDDPSTPMGEEEVTLE